MVSYLLVRCVFRFVQLSLFSIFATLMSLAGRTFAFHTLGCKLNFSESSSMSRGLQEAGMLKTSFNERADVYIINTCSVTENADRECRSIVRGALSRNPEAFVAVVGCYAQLKPHDIAAIEGVDVVLGATEKFRLMQYISFSGKKAFAEVKNCDITDARDFTAAFSSGDRTRSFLKIQDGCDYSCTFCTIPLARGESRSDTPENVLRNVNELISQGVKEIVLTGVNTGDFGYGPLISENGKKRRGTDLAGLLREIEKTGIERVRISSIEPNLLNDDIIGLAANSEKLVPHFHMPLQSGSNEILAAMKRRYRRELYADRVSHIKSLMPDCCIGVDVIVGFPGETKEHFLETYHFLNELPVSYLHVFTYSERDNTEAILMNGIVPVEERKERNRMLRTLSAKKQREFYLSQEGKFAEVLFESENRNGMMQGYTRNYLRVVAPFDPGLTNTAAQVKLGQLDPEGHFSCEVLSEQTA